MQMSPNAVCTTGQFGYSSISANGNSGNGMSSAASEWAQLTDGKQE